MEVARAALRYGEAESSLEKFESCMDRNLRQENSMEFGIDDIGIHIPEGRLYCSDQAARLNILPETLECKIGFHSLARKSSGDDTSDLACHAIVDLINRSGVNQTSITCLVVVTQNPDGYGIPQLSALIHGRMNWSTKVAAFDIALGCSGYVYALSVISGFLRNQGGGCGVLVTADPYSKIVDVDDRSTALLFGDAATATLVSPDGAWKIGMCDFGTAGAYSDTLSLDSNRKLRMMGRQLARKCVQEVPQSIRNALSLNSMSAEDVQCILVHQGSRHIVKSIGTALGLSEKTPFLAEAIGNTCSSSIPIGLRQFLEENPEADAIVLSSFGVGLSWGSTVIKRRQS
jgi:3-oxoacyl-[acyl-carrier-protein] synthase III